MSQEDIEISPLRESTLKELPGFIKRHAEVFRISIFEGMGTMILTYGICCGQYLPPFRDKVTNLYYGFFISCSLFLALCWSGAMTGGHINPAVTLGQMFRSPKVSLRTGLIYMVSQFIGAFFGALFAWVFYDATAGPYSGNVAFLDLFFDFMGEIIGTFLFVFFILMITTPETSFVQDRYWTYIIIALFLYTCRTFSFRAGSLNPAVSFGIMFFKSIDERKGILIVQALSIILGPFIGGYLSGVFFEKVFKKLYLEWKQVEEQQ